MPPVLSCRANDGQSSAEDLLLPEVAASSSVRNCLRRASSHRLQGGGGEGCWRRGVLHGLGKMLRRGYEADNAWICSLFMALGQIKWFNFYYVCTCRKMYGKISILLITILQVQSLLYHVSFRCFYGVVRFRHHLFLDPSRSSLDISMFLFIQ